MIDLTNTYILNDEGELRDLYIQQINKQGIRSAIGSTVSKEWAENRECIEVDHNSHAFYPTLKLLEEKSKQITLADLKPKRTKTEHVKCAFNSAWEVVKAFESGIKLYDDHEFGDYRLIITTADVITSINSNSIYCKVEREITWQDEIGIFIDGNSKLRECLECAADDPNGFIEMCNIVVNATK